MYIAIEGIDGVGKTEQVKMLADYFCKKGRTAHTVAEPDKEFIRSLSTTDQKVIATGMYIQRLKMKNTYEQMLDRGEFIVSDRCFASTFAYQGQYCWYFVKSLHQSMLDSILLPDLVFILHLDPKIAIERVKFRDGEINDHEEQVMFRAADLYKRGCTPFVRSVQIDANTTREAMNEKIIEHTKIVMQEIGLGRFA